MSGSIDSYITAAVSTALKPVIEDLTKQIDLLVYISTQASEKKYSDDQLLDDREVAKLTGMSTSTLRNMRTAKTGIPYTKVGNSVRYRMGDIRRYVAGNLQRVIGDEAL
ncbi:helix-turn-helix transcriptional regulator [Limisalsivibrio acetivorans]|uniref:helix-turn-helix transcriptional regulator n=1 Tax=Limisalsivibrio acetivorans TaxID=1304888 RepID=UPI0003B473D2|nr:helix-turn-helix domain-containing protein [Limisalsivibrio acetivorans]